MNSLTPLLLAAIAGLGGIGVSLGDTDQGSIEQFVRKKDQLAFSLEGGGASRVRFRCAKAPAVRLDGQTKPVRFDAQLRTATFETRLKPEKPVRIELFP